MTKARQDKEAVERQQLTQLREQAMLTKRIQLEQQQKLKSSRSIAKKKRKSRERVISQPTEQGQGEQTELSPDTDLSNPCTAGTEKPITEFPLPINPEELSKNESLQISRDSDDDILKLADRFIAQKGWMKELKAFEKITR
jgi:hypothetical protein